MPKLRKDGKPDGRSKNAGNAQKAREALSSYIKKGRKMREEQEEDDLGDFKITDSDLELGDDEATPQKQESPQKRHPAQSPKPPPQEEKIIIEKTESKEEKKPRRRKKVVIEVSSSDSEEEVKESFRRYKDKYKTKWKPIKDDTPPESPKKEQKFNHLTNMSDMLKMRIMGF